MEKDYQDLENEELAENDGATEELADDNDEEEFAREDVEINYTSEDVARMENEIKNLESQIEEIDNDEDCDDDETVQS